MRSGLLAAQTIACKVNISVMFDKHAVVNQSKKWVRAKENVNIRSFKSQYTLFLPHPVLNALDGLNST
jgi:hypothetical protein